MTRYSALLVATGIGIFFTSPVWAGLELVPVNTSFTLTGKFQMGSVGGPFCLVTMTGSTNSGANKNNAGEVTGASTSTPKCSRVSFVGFPWPIALIDKKDAVMSGVSFGYNGNGCAPGTMNLTIFKRGHWNWSWNGGLGNCDLVGDTNSYPPITILRN
jgi:hypothetical protein